MNVVKWVSNVTLRDWHTKSINQERSRRDSDEGGNCCGIEYVCDADD